MNIAAIDCGTNSTRLLVTDRAGNKVREELRITRLGEGVHANRTLLPTAIERTAAALREFRALMLADEVGYARAVATSAARDATNADEFFAATKNALGFDVEVISGEEEATLSFAGATAGRDADADYLVVDIGGGSIEFVLGTRREIAFAESFDLGCVRLTEMLLHSDPPTSTELASVASLVRDQLVASELPGLARARRPQLLAVAGTATSLAALDLELDRFDSDAVHGHVLSRDRLADLHSHLSGVPTAARTSPVMPRGRAEVIVAGTAALLEIVDLTAAPQVVISTSDILVALAGSIDPQDDRYRL